MTFTVYHKGASHLVALLHPPPALLQGHVTMSRDTVCGYRRLAPWE